MIQAGGGANPAVEKTTTSRILLTERMVLSVCD
jgi:hypothetical protein